MVAHGVTRVRSPGFRCVAWCLIAQFLVVTFGVNAAVAATVRVPGGTPVIVRLDETVTTRNKSAGDNVRASVAADVSVGGTVVIRSGAPAVGQITHVKKPAAVGTPGEIALNITAVQAVNGEMIRVIPQSASGEGESKQTTSLVITLLCCILGLLMKGGQAEIQTGTTINTHTAQELHIEIQD